jgi:acetolactate synthase-1/2/3 large subunit
MHGGDRVAEVLKARGVRFLFTLCGGHISPILVGAKARGIRVVDVRHEVNAVFAADAVARMTGVPGVAAVTAGPGLTNTITALKNAELAQSPLVLLGGATATMLKGRGALQDIDQRALIEPHVKWMAQVTKVKDLVPAVEQAFDESLKGVPGPTFVECPVDLLYPEEIVREWYGAKGAEGKSLGDKALSLYMSRHVQQLFSGEDALELADAAPRDEALHPAARDVEKAAELLLAAERPVVLVGSQALVEAGQAERIASALEQIGAPVWLSGMGRGLLGAGHPLHMRHKRRDALKDADLVLLAGSVADFRLDYGRHIKGGGLKLPGQKKNVLIAAGRRRADLYKNKWPTLAVPGDAGAFLCELAAQVPPATQEGGERWRAWREQLRERDDARDTQIAEQAGAEAEGGLNPIQLCREVEEQLPAQSVLVADGGDFVATASYTMRPRSPLSWLDPGVFGTLGVGAGFALGAKLVRPDSEVWIVYGDGSVGYSLAEFDTFARHGLGVIALVGNDACWMQIARDQVELLGDDVGVMLTHTDYHHAAEGFGGKGLLLKEGDDLAGALQQAKAWAREGTPVLINAHIGKTDFRKGSISI